MSMKHKIGRWFAGKAFGLSQYAQMWLTGQDMPNNTTGKPTRPYAQVELVFACVNKLIDGIAGLPLMLSTDDDRIVESGPAYDMLFNNPAMSFASFVTQSIGHYALSRDVFWIFSDTEVTRPKDIMVVPGTQMKPVTHNRRPTGDLIGWEFVGSGGQGIQLGIDEVHQWKNFNPHDRFHGLGPATASDLSIGYSYAASMFNTSSLQNAAEPGAILTTQGSLDPDQVNMLRDQFEARHKGPGQAKRTAILTGGMDIKTVALKMTDMQVAKISTMADHKICSTFGVPPGVVGMVTEAQYSHGPAQRDFIFNTIIPLARLFAGEITSGIINKLLSGESRSRAVTAKEARTFAGGDQGLARNRYYRAGRRKALANQTKIFAWFDADQHPTVQDANREMAEKVLGYTKSGVPLNALIEAHDLPYDTVDWGDDWWIPMGQVPARYTLEAGAEGLTGESLREGEPAEADEDKSDGERILEKCGWYQDEPAETADPQAEKADEQQRLRLWRNWVVSWAGIERGYKESMRQYFLRQQRILTAKLKKALAEVKDKSQTKDDVDRIVARVTFDLTIENGKIQVINQTFFGKGAELGIRQTLSEVSGLSGEELTEATEQAKRRPAIKASLLKSSQRITKVNAATQRRVAEQLSQGLEVGEGLNELSGRIRQTLGSNRARALSIARTQTAGAVSTGRQAGMSHAGVELKSWVTSGDDHVRPAHTEAGSRYAEGIALDVPFDVGGEMLMYPGDPAGSAGNIINCRCLHIARRAAGKRFDDAWYAGHKFYAYSDMPKADDSDKDNLNE